MICEDGVNSFCCNAKNHGNMSNTIIRLQVRNYVPMIHIITAKLYKTYVTYTCTYVIHVHFDIITDDPPLFNLTLNKINEKKNYTFIN